MQLDITKVKLRSRNIKCIYFDAFPKNERMPFFMMEISHVDLSILPLIVK